MGNLAISFWVGRRIYSMEKKECNTFWGLSITSLTKQVRWSMLQLAVEVDSDRQTHTHTHTHTNIHKHTNTHNHFSHLFHICCCYSYNEFMSVINRSWQGIQKPHHIACCLYHGWIYHPLATGSVDCIPLYMLWQVHSPWLEGEVVTAPV